MTTQKNNANPELEQVARRLATLLKKAEPLARRLDEDPDAAKYRAQVRELVGGMRFFTLSTILNNLCGERVWHIAHATNKRERRRLSEPSATALAFDGTRISRVRRTNP